MSVLLAAQDSGPGAGPIEFLIIVLVGVATVLLVRNMNGRLKRLPPSFPSRRPESGPDQRDMGLQNKDNEPARGEPDQPPAR